VAADASDADTATARSVMDAKFQAVSDQRKMRHSEPVDGRRGCFYKNINGRIIRIWNVADQRMCVRRTA